MFDARFQKKVDRLVLSTRAIDRASKAEMMNLDCRMSAMKPGETRHRRKVVTCPTSPSNRMNLGHLGPPDEDD